MGRKKKEDIFKIIKNGCEKDFSGVKFKLYLFIWFERSDASGDFKIC